MNSPTDRARAAVSGRRAGGEVALADDKAPSVASYITRLQPQIAKALPRHMNAERVTRLALTVVRQSVLAKQNGTSKTSLAECSPESFAGSLLTCAALGLEPGVNGEAYLVPYKGECTLIVGYQGYAKLFWQHPLAKHLDAHAVHTADQFDYAYGLGQYLRHKPARTDRGEITDYYAVAELSTGASAFVVLTRREVRDLRGGKEGPSGQIPDPQHWMERKTALRQLVKLLPKSAMLAAALEVDDQPGSLLAERGVPASIAEDQAVPALPARPVEAGFDAGEAALVDPATGEILDPDAVAAGSVPVEPTEDDYAAMNAEAAQQADDDRSANPMFERMAREERPRGKGRAR